MVIMRVFNSFSELVENTAADCQRLSQHLDSYKRPSAYGKTEIIRRPGVHYKDDVECLRDEIEAIPDTIRGWKQVIYDYQDKARAAEEDSPAENRLLSAIKSARGWTREAMRLPTGEYPGQDVDALTPDEDEDVLVNTTVGRVLTAIDALRVQLETDIATYTDRVNAALAKGQSDPDAVRELKGIAKVLADMRGRYFSDDVHPSQKRYELDSRFGDRIYQTTGGASMHIDNTGMLDAVNEVLIRAGQEPVVLPKAW